MTHSQLDAMLAESLLAPEDTDQLAAVLAPLASLSGQAPAPSAELELLFGAETPSGTVGSEWEVAAPRSGRRGRGTVAGVVVLALSGVGATGLSAAANTLPGPWQHQVSKFSHQHLPFHFPDPKVGPPAHSPKPHDARPTPRRPRDVGDAQRNHEPEQSASETRTGPEVHGAPSSHGQKTDGESRRDRTSHAHPRPLRPAQAEATSPPPGELESEEDDAGVQLTFGYQETRAHVEGPLSSGSTNKHTDTDKHADRGDRPVKGKSKGTETPKDRQKGKPSGSDDRDDSGPDWSDDVDPGRGDEENLWDVPEGGQQQPDDRDAEPANDPDRDWDNDRDNDQDRDWDPHGDSDDDHAWEPDLQVLEGDAPRT